MFNLKRYSKIAIDTETTGLKHASDRLFGISLAVKGQSWYFNIQESPDMVSCLREELKNYDGWIVGHNLKFDVNFLRQAGIDISEKKLDCTLVKAVLVNEHEHSYSLDNLANKYLGAKKIEIYPKLAELFGGRPTRKAQMKNLHKAPTEIVAPYARVDAELALALDDYLNFEIRRQNLHQILALERRVLKVLIDMEYRGVRVDVEQAEKSFKLLEAKVEQGKKQLNNLAGFEVNPNPSKSIIELFKPKRVSGKWVAIDGTELAETPKGKPSINKNALERMKHPAAALILVIRKMIKTKDVFIREYIIESSVNGRVYPNINQVKGPDGGTITGRLSVTSPALQQIPARDKQISALTRSLFIPEDGHKWYCADYSQADARAFVHYTKSPPLVRAYRENRYTDFHTLTANLTGLPRNAPKSGGANAKQLGLGLLFSMGEGTMAEEMGLPFQVINGMKFPGPQAKKVFENFHRSVPGVKEFARRATSTARMRGYIKSVAGRRLRFPDKNFAYKAAGYLFQSATAEINKIKMVEEWEFLKGTDTDLLLSVHDELNFSSDDPDLMEEVKKIMETVNFLDIPMVVSMNSGDNWYDAK